jgi:hypothetical protein
LLLGNVAVKLGALCGEDNVIPYRKFSDTLKDGNFALTPPNLPKAPKVDTGDHTTVDALGGLGALGGLQAEIQDEAPAAVKYLIAPLFKCGPPAAGQPALEQPFAPRSGHVEERDGALLHFCRECGRWGSYGYDVRLRTGQLGRWYCREHRPPSSRAG